MKFFKVLIVIIYIESAGCSYHGLIDARVKELRARAKQLYGAGARKVVKLWEFELEDRLAYPRGDKRKLAELSNLWMGYYSCCARRLGALGAAHALPADSVCAFQGARASLPCALCIAPDEMTHLVWMYAQSLEKLTFAPMGEKETAVQEADGSMTIYHVRKEDAGVYRCQVGDTGSGPVVLEVMDYEENYTVVKPAGSRGPYASPAQRIDEDLALFSSWSRWSECSRCGRVGRRRRYGLCYVGLAHRDGNKRPIAVPCKTGVVFLLRSENGDVFESANNSAGVYSLMQRAPPQAPAPAREIVFAARDKSVVLRCPGTSLRDTPVEWRVGTLTAAPRELYKGSEGRLYINARDHLVINRVRSTDANLYSCWEAEELAGTVRLEVWSGARSPWNPHFALTMLVVGFVLALRCAERALRGMRRRAGR